MIVFLRMANRPESQGLEDIVYAWAKYITIVIGGRKLDSSYDRYDTEYGWTAEDYRRAAGGLGVSYYTVGLGVYSSITKSCTEFTPRLLGVLLDSDDGDVSEWEKKKAVEGRVILRGRGDIVVFHKFGNRLLDIGKYGIVDTLTNETLCPLPQAKDEILQYDGTSIVFREAWPAFYPPVFRINLTNGLEEGRFREEEVSKDESIIPLVKERHERGLWRSHLGQFTVKVNGETFTIDNKLIKGWMAVESSKMITPTQEVIWQGDYSKYIIAAVGFPARRLLEKSSL